MKYRLLCVDLDGTLLTDHKKLNEQDIECILYTSPSPRDRTR